MDKGNTFNGALALPGFARQGKKPFGDKFSSSTRDIAPISSSKAGDDTAKDFGRLDDSSSLVDERGLLLAPSSELSLQHLTKSRPRNQGRRTPSPSARRKSWRQDDDSLSEGDTVIPTLGYDRGKDSFLERERVPWDHEKEANHLPAPSKSKPKFCKSLGSDLRDGQAFGHLPPPLPASPPPPDFEEDFESLGRTNFTAGKLSKAFPTERSSMSTKMDYHRPEAITKVPPVFNSQNTLRKSDKSTQEKPSCDPKPPKMSGDSYRKEAMAVTPAISSDPGVNSSTSKGREYYRGPVELEKSSSTRRRRFKPVKIPDKSESGCSATESADENLSRSFSRSKNLFDTWLDPPRERMPAAPRSGQHFMSASTPKVSYDPQIASDRGRKDNGENLEKREFRGTNGRTNLAVGDDNSGGIRIGKSDDSHSIGKNTASSHQLDSFDIRILLVGDNTVENPSNSPSLFLTKPDDNVRGHRHSFDLPESKKQNGVLSGFSHRELKPQLGAAADEKKKRKPHVGEENVQEKLWTDNGMRSTAEDLQHYNDGGVPEPDDENTVIQPPTEFVKDSQEKEPEVFEPPPMFAQSSDEDQSTTNNRHSVFLDEKFLSATLDNSGTADEHGGLEEMVEGLRPFHHKPLDMWCEEDTMEWLDYIGLGRFAQEFKNHGVDGKALKTISYPLLEEIGITSADEREIILSEIYQLSNPDEYNDIEQQLQDALQGASDEDRDKVLAVLTALKSPEFNPLVDIPSTASSSPRDSHVTSDTASVSSSMTSGEDHVHDIGMPPPPPPPKWPDSQKGVNGTARVKVGGVGREDVQRTGESGSSGKDKKKKNSGKNKKEKKSKGVGKLIDSLSHSSKLGKLFGAKKLNPTMQYLLQVGPQGILRVWPRALSEETNYCSFMVSMTTSSAQVVRLVLDKYDAIEDPRRFYISEVQLSKGGAHYDLKDNECPLLRQCRWPDPEKYRFELRCRDEGAIKMLFDLEGYEDDLDYRRLAISSLTPCTEALQLIVRKFELPGKPSEYILVEVSEENEGDRQIVAENVYPLRLQMAWSEPDHVFRLCRLISGHTAHLSTEDLRPAISPSPNYDETDFHSAARHAVGDEDVTLVQDSSQLESRPDRAGNVAGNSESGEVGEQREELLRRERRVQQLEYQNKELMEKLKELEEKSRAELEVRDREIERLYSKHSASSTSDKEAELSSERTDSGHFGDESKLVEKIIDLQQRHKELELTAGEAEDVKRINRELAKKVDEGLISKQDLKRIETQRQEMALKVREMEKTKDEIESRLGKQVESLKRENQELAGKAKDVDKMKQNVIRLTAQLRSMDSGKPNATELQDLREKLNKVELEKSQVQSKLEELQRETAGAKEECQDSGELQLENITLEEKSKDAAELKLTIEQLKGEVKQNDMYRHKYVELTAVESYLRKQLSNLENVVHTKDQRIKDYENKLKAMTQLVKDMEAKLEEQEQHRAYLDQLLPILKQRDPSLLNFMNSSLVSKDPEEWC